MRRRPLRVARAQRTAAGFRQTTASSLTEFLTRAQEFHNDWFEDDPMNPLWFRGQGDGTTPLQQRLYCDETGDVDEDETRYELARKAIQFPMVRPSSDWE